MISVREAMPDDSRSLWEWRNDPVTRANSLSTEPVPLAAHEAWFAAVLADPDRALFVGQDPQLDRIGVVRFDIEGSRALVSINLAPHARGRGLAGPLLNAAIAQFTSSRTAVRELVAQIKTTNTPSLRIFEGAGFTSRDETDGVRTWVRAV